jgi:hypothetical protein
MEAAVEGEELLGFGPLILGFSFLAFEPDFLRSQMYHSIEAVQEGLVAKS